MLSAANTAPPTPAEIRQKGNQWIKQFRSGGFTDYRRKCLYRALECYEQAKEKAGKRDYDEIASNYKNIGICYARLEAIEPRRQAAIYYAKSATKARAKALEYGELAPKTYQWLIDVAEDLAKTVNLYIQRSSDLVEDAIGEILQCARIDSKSTVYHKMMGTHRIDQSERMLAKCMQLVGERNFKVALPKLHEIHFPIEEAKLHTKGYEALKKDVLVAEQECSSFLAIAEALQSHSFGENAMEDAMKATDYEKKTDLGFIAMDHFKQCEVLARGEDVEIVAMAQTSTGMVLYKVFKLREKAKLCFREALDLSTTLFGQLYGRPWYITLTNTTQEIRDKEFEEENKKWENRRKPFLKELEEDLKEIWAMENAEPAAIIDFLFEKFPAKHVTAEKPDTTLSGKKRLLKLSRIYHPDKIDEEEMGTKYKVLFEEISKMINNRYSMMKGMD